MEKPVSFSEYSEAQVNACERTLVTLLRGLGPWKKTVVLVGGMAPRYLVRQDGFEDIPRHIGTSDVDLVLDLDLLADIEAYRRLEQNLQRLRFERGSNNQGNPQHFRWKRTVDSKTEVVVDLLCDTIDRGGRVNAVPNERRLSAIGIPGARLAMSDPITILIGAETLDGGGYAEESVNVTRIAPFVVLKALAYDDRWERKDAYDLIYALQYFESGPADVAREFVELQSRFPDDPNIITAIGVLERRFGSDSRVSGVDKDGPVSYALFLTGDIGAYSSASLRNEAVAVVRQFLDEVARKSVQE